MQPGSGVTLPTFAATRHSGVKSKSVMAAAPKPKRGRQQEKPRMDAWMDGWRGGVPKELLVLNPLRSVHIPSPISADIMNNSIGRVPHCAFER